MSWVQREAPRIAMSSTGWFESQLVENFDDDCTLAAYADWLSERGDVRGELVALRRSYEERGCDAITDRTILQAEEHVFERSGAALLGGLGRAGCVWRQGFAREVSIRG